MIMEYTEDMFEDDKKEMLVWLEKNWTYADDDTIHLGNILRELRSWVEEIKRNNDDK